jgi:hypothetical protein
MFSPSFVDLVGCSGCRVAVGGWNRSASLMEWPEEQVNEYS